MLNDYGKALFKPLVSVQNCLLVLSTIYVVWLLVRVFHLNSSEIASWVQAIGSIAAILGAFAISNNQVKRQEEQREIISEQKSKAFFAVVKHAVDHARGVRDALDSDELKRDFKLGWNSGYSEIFKSSVKSMGLIPVHELGEYDLVIAHNHILAAVINISKSIESYALADSFADQELALLSLNVAGHTAVIDFYWTNFEKA